MGNIGSHSDITSKRRGRQANGDEGGTNSASGVSREESVLALDPSMPGPKPTYGD